MGGRVRGKAVVARSWKGVYGGRLLASLSVSLCRAIHGGVKHGETARMIDGILRCCGHGMGTYPHRSRHTAVGNPLSKIDKRATPPGGHVARGIL